MILITVHTLIKDGQTTVFTQIQPDTAAERTAVFSALKKLQQSEPNLVVDKNLHVNRGASLYSLLRRHIKPEFLKLVSLPPRKDQS